MPAPSTPAVGPLGGCVPVTQLESINCSTLELRTLGFTSGSH